jgi:hypothetical protein
MKKMLLFAGLLMLSALLCAEIGYWPRLSLIEMGLDTPHPNAMMRVRAWRPANCFTPMAKRLPCAIIRANIHRITAMT